MDRTLEWWLEPILIGIGHILDRIINGVQERGLLWFCDHAEEGDEEYRKRISWGLPFEEYGAIYDHSWEYTTLQMERKEYTSDAIRKWYYTSFFFSQVIGAHLKRLGELVRRR